MSKREDFNTLFNAGLNYDAYSNRSERNEDRMKIVKEAAVEYLTQHDEKIDKLNTTLKVLCIAENWCGDCANAVPAIAELADRLDKWDFSIAPRDDFELEVERHYTTAGRKKIPVLILADEDGDEVIRWVERPRNSYRILNEIKAKRLSKEEYTKEYRKNTEINPPGVVKHILDEIMYIASKAAYLVNILPPKSDK